jgi:hypothetical protein
MQQRVLLAARAELIFSQSDGDGSGCMSVGELRPALEQLGLSPSAKQVRALLVRYDGDGSGSIDRSEFLEIVKAVEEEVRRERIEDARAEAEAKAAPGRKQRAGELAAQRTIAKLDRELQEAEERAQAAGPPLKAASSSSSMLTAVVQEARKAKQEPGKAAATTTATVPMPPVGAETSERSYR